MRYLISVLLLSAASVSWVHSAAVQIVASSSLSKPAEHGLGKLREALASRGLKVVVSNRIDEALNSHLVLAGLASDSEIAKHIVAAGLALPEAPQSLAIAHRRDDDGHHTVVLCGADAVGLMYAALDTARLVRWAADDQRLFADISATFETPRLSDRSVSTYTMQRRWFEKRLHDPAYWDTYFDLLAANRINGFVIIFGYECGGFMAPMYPFFFNVDGYPEVRLTGMSAAQQARNTAALQHVIDSAHQRGIRITLGIWDHIYRGGVQAGGIEGASIVAGKKVPHLVHGVTTENLSGYTKAALGKLLEVFPGIDGIQFRMHWESGLTREETPGFWHDVFETLHELNPDIRFDLRAKGLPDEVIEDAIQQDLPFRVTTKYWMEQLGMPFHPTHINPQNQRDRRHGYADLLRYPKRYDMHWRIWNGGTTRLLLWGNPQYVRRFVQSAQIYGGDGFEVNEMLATKMLGQPHDAEPFRLHPDAYRHYDYEFQRYWHFYQLWGRLSYNPDADPQFWQREFEARFGHQAGPAVMRALHRASDILPRIVAASYNYRYFPTTRGWAEMMRFGDLPQYAAGTGTDVEQFQSYRDAARHLLDGEGTALRTPQQTAAWFETVADQVLGDVQTATATSDQLMGPSKAELVTTTTDLKILAHLARYHAARMRASVWYNVYLQAGKDKFAIERCLADESQAISAWRDLIAAAADVYPETLHFGVHRVGFSNHWKEELVRLEAGYEQLLELPRNNTLEVAVQQRLQRQVESPTRGESPVRLQRAARARPRQDLLITANVQRGSHSPLSSVQLRYRHLNQFEDYRTAKMAWDPQHEQYIAEIPGDFIVPEWDLMYFVEVIDDQGRGWKLPDLDTETPYVVVAVER